MPEHQSRPPSDTVQFRDVTAVDTAWIRDLHREIYLEHFGWPASFMEIVDALLATLMPRLLANQHVPDRRERSWIATIGNNPVGAIFIVQHDEPAIAKLRMLVVSDTARGQGIGTTLIDRVVDFARDRGYARIELWTESTLTSARRLYETAGFRIVEETPSDIVPGATAETWRLDLHADR